MKKIILLAMLFVTITFGQSLPFLLFDDDREAPSAPTSPSAVGTAEAVAISWTDPTALDCDSIRIYGGTSTAPTTWIASVAKGTQTYNWTGRTAQTLYYLRVKAKDLTGNLSDYTSTVSDTALNTQYALDTDGSTEYLSKASPISLDLNGAEMVYKDSNSTFESGDTTDWASNGTHSIDTSSTRKYAGSYSGKVIATGVGDTTTNFISLASSNFTTLEAGKKYTVEYWVNADSTGNGFTTKPTITTKIGSKSWTSDTISYYPGQFEKVVYNFQATSAEVNTPIKFYLSQADTIYYDNFSITEAKDLLISTWQYLVDDDEIQGIISYHPSASPTGTQRIGFALNANNTMGVIVGSGVNYYSDNTYDYSSKLDNWALCQYKLDRTAQTVKFYINGDSVKTISSANLGAISGWTSPQLLIGYINMSRYHAGKIGETQIATFSDISTLNYTPAQLYYRGKAGYFFPTALTGGTVVGHWTWEGADIDASLTDKSGTGNTLTPTAIDITDRTVITY